jgi:hypothetical protein
MLGCDVPGAHIHDVEYLATLVRARVAIGVAIDGLQCPLGVLELHLLVLILLRIHLLFSLPLMGRRAFLALLLLHLHMELLRELLYLKALLSTVVPGIAIRASHDTVIIVRCLMGLLVTSWTMAPTCRCNCSGGCPG